MKYNRTSYPPVSGCQTSSENRDSYSQNQGKGRSRSETDARAKFKKKESEEREKFARSVPQLVPLVLLREGGFRFFDGKKRLSLKQVWSEGG